MLYVELESTAWIALSTFSWIKNEAAGAPAGADARHDACGPHFHESLAGGVDGGVLLK